MDINVRDFHDVAVRVAVAKTNFSVGSFRHVVIYETVITGVGLDSSLGGVCRRGVLTDGTN